ncbi:ubiquitin carboxyl-terminal hydrolase [Salpingoeca rosetta]|uniref:ubiquitinyl hydrolase 1 n=1 Tax=Salpingoeca rosetta (strain ATCC 50818 / BSB-021) TaxID=946362 RepID=F2U5E4_SALR5|nr:ubiquitin carboxyl-terminal hydrolase [Salpingoeca rosetta]EGD83160.1 ubiquitin carboxyl-terminal hydrolase [Salpingoeca rosetta]|eukprot:XP_004995524.1 ubiquitin carboxyl-terminal hydrolase [Salpingoeca rosetta]
MDLSNNPTEPPEMEDTTQNWDSNAMDQENESQDDPVSSPSTGLLGTPPGKNPAQPTFEQEELKTHFDTVLHKGSKDFVIRNFTSYKFHTSATMPNEEHLILGDTEWTLLVFPAGDKSPNELSVYAELVKGPEDSHKVFANILFTAVGSKPEYRVSKCITHCFSDVNTNYGYPRFVTHPMLRDYGFIKDDTVTVRLDIEVLAGYDFNLFGAQAVHDTKKTTGMVGLANQGATCYMNSLLQALYHTPALRRAVYTMPTANDSADTGVALALQRVFYRLQTQDHEVSTTELTKSFGWDTRDAFMQHDVQEFSRVLMDNLEEKMKGTPVEETVKKLFAGRMKSYVRCINVDFESSREEDFYDIQLNVKDIASLQDSFKDYVNVETLEGDNQYRAEGHGLQDAKKGVIFQSFPPVLHLQLKRFAYSFLYDDYHKINDRFEFPPHIDLSDFLEDPSSSPAKFTLQAVLVHSGTTYGGHYTAFISPEADGRWYHFDDELVYRTPANKAIEDNFGSAAGAYHRGGGNAYMLVYVRDDVKDEVLKPMADDEIPPALRDRFEGEEAERRRLEEERLFNREKIKFKIYPDELFDAHADVDLIRVAPGVGEIERIHESYTPRALLEEKAEQMNVRVDRLRLWLMRSIGRQGMRVIGRLSDEECELSWQQLLFKYDMKLTKDRGFTRLYVEYYSETDEQRQHELCSAMDVGADDQQPAVEGAPTTDDDKDKDKDKGEASSEETPKTQDKNAQGAEAGRMRGLLPDDSHASDDEDSDEYVPKSDILVFVKHFDIYKGRLRHLKRLHICSATTMQQIVDACRPLAGVSPDRECLLFLEEFFDSETPQATRIPLLAPEKTAADYRLDHGALLIFQAKPLDTEEYKYPYAEDWFHKRCDEYVVKVAQGRTGAGQHQVMTLNAMLTYQELQEKIAAEFELEHPSHIRLYRRHDQHYGTPISSTTTATLDSMCTGSGKLKFLNFVVLDKPVQEKEQEVNVTCEWFSPTDRKTDRVTKTVNRDLPVADIVAEIAREKEVPEEDMQWIRSAGIAHSEFVDLDRDTTAGELSHRRLMLRVELIPEDQRNMDDATTLLEIRHFWHYPASSHGDPFYFAVHDDELVKDFCQRVKTYLHISDKEFEQWKPHLCAGHIATPLDEDEKLQPKRMMHDQWLAFEHVDKTRVPRYGEAAVKIHN